MPNESLQTTDIKILPWQQTRVYHITREVEITTGSTIKIYTHSCDMEINYVARKEENHIISIFRKEYQINNKFPDLLATKITGMLQRGLYPVECIVDHLGNWTGIANMQEVRKNWEQRVSRVRNEYQGEGVDSIIEAMENNLTEEHRFLKALQKDLLHAGLFIPLPPAKNTGDENQNTEVTIPVTGIGTILTRGRITCEEEEEETKMHFKGKPEISETSSDHIKEYFDKKGIEFTPERFSGTIQIYTEIKMQPFTSRKINIDLSCGNQWKHKEEIHYQLRGISVI